MKRNWTSAQKKAIELQNRSLLVSAAAGSGKTAVLTERVIRRITDEKNPVPLDRLLIVTFTRAAADELRSKIRLALENALAEDEENGLLKQQLLKLESAQISTIHSFCYNLIRENFARLSLPAALRIADEAEISLLKKAVAEEVIDDYYENDISGPLAIENFEDFCDHFLKSKTDETMADTFIKLYTDIISYPERTGFLQSCRREYDKIAESRDGIAQSSFFEKIREDMLLFFAHYRKAYAEIYERLSGDEAFAKKYQPAFDADLDFMMQFSEIRDYAELREKFSRYTKARVSAISAKEKTEEHDRARELRAAFHKEAAKWKERYTGYAPEQLQALAQTLSEICENLYRFLTCFEERLQRKKNEKKILDFSDLEQYAFQLLYDAEKRQPTALAAAKSLEYDEIYIDEYQDVNELQDIIFSCISRNNRFMVGDIKQSIYGFRGAEPSVFARYRSAFPEYSEEEPDSSANTVFLSENFRCNKNVIDFTNAVFSVLFRKNTGRIPYSDKDELVFSKPAAQRCGAYTEEPVKIILIGAEDCADTGEERGADEMEKAAAEAKYIAGEMNRLLRFGIKEDGSRLEQRDIAVLLRSTKRLASVYEREIRKYNIGVFNNAEPDFFENAEVLLVLCILCTVDNPSKDIFLAGALRSPVYGFTLEDLTAIRLEYPDGTLYSALCAYREKHQDEKTAYFLDKLAYYRYISEGMPTDKFIWFLYRDAGILSLVHAKNDGDDRPAELKRANLMLLYDYARRFEAGSFKGLYNFISYINDVIDRSTKFENAKLNSEAENCVRITTIHKSKGLEFPVVFVANATADFTKKPQDGAAFIYEAKSGFSAKVKDQSGLALYETPMYHAIRAQLSKNNAEEEMRVLYVALTRARERLYITAEGRDAIKTAERARMRTAPVSAYELLHSKSYLEWILAALAPYGEQNSFFTTTRIAPQTLFSSDKLLKAPMPEPSSEESAQWSETEEGLYQTFRERFAFRYPGERLAKLPQKVSVSRLYPAYLDEFDTSAVLNPERSAFSFQTPHFLLSGDAEEKSTAAQRGISTHLFMQFCDFGRVEQYGVREEAQRLAEEKFIYREALKDIYYREIEEFFCSDLYQQMRGAICEKRIFLREYRFNIRLNASDFTQDEQYSSELTDEKLLVQGVIDCLFETHDGSLVLFDYKTDRVRDTEADIQKFTAAHENQLRYYKKAAEKLTKKRVSRTCLYSFSLSRTVELAL